MPSTYMAGVTFGSTRDLATYCEQKSREAHKARLAAKTHRQGLVLQREEYVYNDLANLIRSAVFTSEQREP